MRSLVNYYEERHIIYEAKFKNLNDDELAACADLLKSIIDNDYPVMQKSWTNRIIKEPQYGEKYFVKFKNPFADQLRFSSKTGKTTKIEGEEDVIQCIGIADKFGRIFLQNIWDKSEPAYIEYKKSETKTTKSGKTYTTDAGWYLTRKDIEAYKVKKWYSDKRGESPMHFVDDKKTKGAWGISLKNDIEYVKDLTSIPKDVEKINADIAKRAEEENRRKQKEEERKKFWDDRKDYKNYGCTNGWEKTPDEVKKAWNDKDAEWFTVSLGRCYTQYWCDTYKLYYSEDSSD